MIRLIDGVYTWSRFDQDKRFNFNGHLLRTPEGTLIIDPVPFTADDLSYLQTTGLKPDALLITNRNHLRDRDAVLERWRIPTLMHGLEIESAGIAPDRVLKNGDSVFGLLCVHLPGKSPGEVGLYWEERGAFLVGDALIAPYGKLRTVPLEKQEDPARLKESLRLLEGFEFEHLLVGDGDPILMSAKKDVKAFLQTP